MTGATLGAVYLDTSALAKLVAAEPETPALIAYLAEHPTHVSSAIAIVELGRVVARRPDADIARSVEVVRRLVLVDLDRNLLERAAGLAPAGLRSLDAIHLSTALEVRSAIDALVTYDGRLAAAARVHGFPVAGPA